MSKANSIDAAVPPVIGGDAAKGSRNATLPWLALAAGAVMVCAALLFAFDPSHSGFYPRCMMFTTTGLYCPGCGALRATHHLLHGRFLTALRCNPLYILSLPPLGWLGARSLLHRLRRGVWPALHCDGKTVFWIVTVTLVFTVLRNIHTAPFCYLAPAPGV